MPTLNLTPKKKSTSNKRNETDMRKMRQAAYNTTEWKKLREVYIKRNPLCEECLSKGKVTPATSVHHKESPFSKGSVNNHLLLDYDNLMSVCHECHADIHNREQGKTTIQDVLRQLADLLDENKPDKDFEDDN